MPTYDYRCTQCGWVQSVVRRIKDRNRKPKCNSCDAHGPVERILTVPHAIGWNDQEIFPNLHAYDDLGDVPGGMQFESRAAYDKYLKDEDIREIGVPRCGGGTQETVQVTRYGPKPKPPPSRGSW